MTNIGFGHNVVMFISENCNSNIVYEPVHVYVMKSGFEVTSRKGTKQITQETYIQKRRENLFMIKNNGNDKEVIIIII